MDSKTWLLIIYDTTCLDMVTSRYNMSKSTTAKLYFRIRKISTVFRMNIVGSVVKPSPYFVKKENNKE